MKTYYLLIALIIAGCTQNANMDTTKVKDSKAIKNNTKDDRKDKKNDTDIQMKIIDSTRILPSTELKELKRSTDPKWEWEGTTVDGNKLFYNTK